ncbi:MAG: hypothetical protein KKA42_03715, partial [candidate division Zixibacteria bacterium]|nr:hypothetical protein [candidate division Zixibacteria bacterium]
MTSLNKCMALGLVVVLSLFLVAPQAIGKIIHRSDSTGTLQDLLLLGFGEVTVHGLDVRGNTNAFEASNPSLKDGLSANYRLSLLANGNATRGLMVNGAAILDSRISDEYRTIDPSEFRLRMSVESTEPIWDGWRFTGKGLYDPSRQWEVGNLDTRLLTQPQEPSRLELLMRLESDEHGFVEGGSIRPSFQGAKFSLHQRSVFGVYADLHTGRVGGEAVAGKLEGKAFREGTSIGIRADGTSGPFDLSHAPVTRGSEEVKIQVRDRFDETTVLSTRILVRDIDYTVDYLRGRVLLHQPVASETAAADPVYVVITFDYQRDENDDIMGGRVRVAPVDGVQVSGTYLHRNIDDGATGSGVDEPEDLMAGDASFEIEDHTTGYVEVAGAENPADDDSYSALRLGARTTVVENLTLDAGFQRIDDQFRSFTNSDLDPNKNQQRFNLGGEYELTERQNVTASFVSLRGLEANGQYNRYDGKRSEDILAAGYRNDWMEKLGFGLRLERREVEDRQNADHEDSYRNRAILDVGGRFHDVLVLKQLGYDVNYEMIMFRNNLDIGDHDANTNQVAVTLDGMFSKRASVKLTQRLALQKDRVLDLTDERQDASFATLQLRPHDNVNTLTTYEYKRYTNPGDDVTLWQDNPYRTERAGTFAIEYLPLEKIKAVGKGGRHQSRHWSTDSTVINTDDFMLGQLTYFHTHHLSLGAESEYRRNARDANVKSRGKTWDLGFRVNWNRDRFNEFTIGAIRRWQLQHYQPSDEMTSTSYIMLLSGAVSLTDRFFARGSIKGILLNDPLDDEKTFTKLEVGYDSHDW